MSMKNFNGNIGNRTRDLPACSAGPSHTGYRFLYILPLFRRTANEKTEKNWTGLPFSGVSRVPEFSTNIYCTNFLYLKQFRSMTNSMITMMTTTTTTDDDDDNNNNNNNNNNNDEVLLRAGSTLTGPESYDKVLIIQPNTTYISLTLLQVSAVQISHHQVDVEHTKIIQRTRDLCMHLYKLLQ